MQGEPIPVTFYGLCPMSTACSAKWSSFISPSMALNSLQHKTHKPCITLWPLPLCVCPSLHSNQHHLPGARISLCSTLCWSLSRKVRPRHFPPASFTKSLWYFYSVPATLGHFLAHALLGSIWPLYLCRVVPGFCFFWLLLPSRCQLKCCLLRGKLVRYLSHLCGHLP